MNFGKYGGPVVPKEKGGVCSVRFTVGGIAGFMCCVADYSYKADDVIEPEDTCNMTEGKLIVNHILRK